MGVPVLNWPELSVFLSGVLEVKYDQDRTGKKNRQKMAVVNSEYAWSLFPRPFLRRGGERAWYTLIAYAPVCTSKIFSKLTVYNDITFSIGR